MGAQRPPVMVSFPARPSMTLLPLSPVIVSLLAEPVTFSMFDNVSVPSPGAELVDRSTVMALPLAA